MGAWHGTGQLLLVPELQKGLALFGSVVSGIGTGESGLRVWYMVWGRDKGVVAEVVRSTAAHVSQYQVIGGGCASGSTQQQTSERQQSNCG